MSKAIIVWLKTEAAKYMESNDLASVTPAVISHVLEVAGENNRLVAATAITELIIEDEYKTGS